MLSSCSGCTCRGRHEPLPSGFISPPAFQNSHAPFTPIFAEGAKGPYRLDLGDVLYAPNVCQDGQVRLSRGVVLHMYWLSSLRIVWAWRHPVRPQPCEPVRLPLHLLASFNLSTETALHLCNHCSQGRWLMWGWLQERRKVGSYSYAGCLTLPRVLHCTEDGRLVQVGWETGRVCPLCLCSPATVQLSIMPAVACRLASPSLTAPIPGVAQLPLHHRHCCRYKPTSNCRCFASLPPSQAPIPELSQLRQGAGWHQNLVHVPAESTVPLAATPGAAALDIELTLDRWVGGWCKGNWIRAISERLRWTLS